MIMTAHDHKPLTMCLLLLQCRLKVKDFLSVKVNCQYLQFIASILASFRTLAISYTCSPQATLQKTLGFCNTPLVSRRFLLLHEQ